MLRQIIEVWAFLKLWCWLTRSAGEAMVEKHFVFPWQLTPRILLSEATSFTLCSAPAQSRSTRPVQPRVGPGPALWPTKVSGSFSNNCVRNVSVSLTKAAVETDLSLMQCPFYGPQKGNPLCEMSWKEMQRVSAMEEIKTWVMHHRGTWQRLQSRSLHAAANCKDKPSAHIIISTTVTRSSLCVCSETAKGTQMSASWKEIIIAQEEL